MMNLEMEELIAVIKKYFEGTYKADIDLLKTVFHEDARMTGYLGGKFLLGTPEPFFEDLKAHPAMMENNDPFQVEIRSVTLTGKIASIVIFETGFFGDGRIETHFQLVKENGWKIVSKNFTTM